MQDNMRGRFSSEHTGERSTAVLQPIAIGSTAL